MGIRVVVIDDNPHLRWEGRVHPANATFQRFVAGLLDLPGGPISSIVSCLPLRDASAPPATLPLDERISVVATKPFDGIAGYLRALPGILAANRPVLRQAIAEADLVWIKVPASNAPLASALAASAGVPRFVWVAGSALDVATARFGGPRRVAAQAVGAAYDVIGRASAIGGDRVVVGRELVTSLVEPGELRDPAGRSWPADPDMLRLAWAGRLVEGKGLEALLRATASLRDDLAPRRVELVLLGDGPARAALGVLASELGLGADIRWTGYIADREPYLEILAAADAFVFPSEAEGFPKVVLDAMAVGLPVLARPSGSLAPLVVTSIEGLGPGVQDLGAVVARLDAERAWTELAERGHRFAMEHTGPAELARLVDRWRARWPELPWSSAT